jgi:hypothetical protein
MSFVKIGAVTGHTVCNAVPCPYFVQCWCDLDRVQYASCLDIHCYLRENRRNKNYTLTRGVSKFLSVLFTFIFDLRELGQ